MFKQNATQTVEELSEVLSNSNVEHIVVHATDAMFDALVSALQEMQKAVAKLSKLSKFDHDPDLLHNFTAYANKVSTKAVQCKPTARDEDLASYRELASYFHNAAVKLFPKPKLAELTSHKFKKLYTQQSTARALCLFRAKRILNASSAESCLESIEEAAHELIEHEFDLRDTAKASSSVTVVAASGTVAIKRYSDDKLFRTIAEKDKESASDFVKRVAIELGMIQKALGEKCYVQMGKSQFVLGPNNTIKVSPKTIERLEATKFAKSINS